MANILLFLAIIPVIVIMTYVYNKDRNKEPTKLLVKLFICGIVSCFITLALSDLLEKIIPLFASDEKNFTEIEMLLYVFVDIALVEEFSKWIMTYNIGYKSEEFDEIYDSIVYAVFVSLGFACFENLLYVFANQSIGVGILRGILSVPGHACYGLYMGYFLSLAMLFSKRGRSDLERRYLILSLVVPTILHGIYDYCLMSGINILFGIFLLFVVLLFVFSVKRLKKIADDTTQLVMKNRFCKNCGTPVKGLFCNNCGTRQE